MANIEAVLSKFDDESEEQRFFKKLYEKLDESCILKSVKKRIKQAKNTINKAIQQYFQSVILMNVILSVREDQEVAELHDALPLYLNMIKRYLPDKDSTEFNPLGLSQEDLNEVLEQKQLSKAHHSLLVRCVESRLDEFCSTLLEYAAAFDSVIGFVPNYNWKNFFDDVMKRLEYEAELLSNDDKTLPSEKLFKEMQQTYYKELLTNVTLLNKLLSLHKNKLQFESCAVQYYSSKCEALQLKASLFELEILENTYTKETIPALAKISDQLDTKAKNLEEELIEKSGSVEEYQRLGETFESLVEEYTYLTKCITEKKWSYDELKRRTELKSDS